MSSKPQKKIVKAFAIFFTIKVSSSRFGVGKLIKLFVSEIKCDVY